MALDGPALAKALTTPQQPEAGAGLATVHSTLCRREAGAFQRAAKTGDDLLVACTQESRLFLALNEQTEGAPGVQERPIRFVNLRESGAWTQDARAGQPGAAARLTPKLAALIAAAQLPDPEPVPTVSYRSAGRVMVIGPAERAQAAADRLSDVLDVSLLLPQPGGRMPQQRSLPVHAGQVTAVTGWLGAFEVRWTSGNPIDLDLCTRCNACIAACPEGAIDFSYQVDLSRCGSHRDCVAACVSAAAIDFNRAPQEASETTDLVLDLSDQPLLGLHQPPQGYVHVPPGDAEALFDAVLRLRGLVGEFEKPKFFQYKAKLCAHSRNEQIGCRACIDVCSAQAIRSDASLKGKVLGKGRTATDPVGGIVVEPQLCVGCGACTTVCPSGALTYATPRAPEQGRRIRTMLGAYARAGGRDAALLIHSQGAGSQALQALGRAALAGLGGDPGGGPAQRSGPALMTRLPAADEAAVRGLPLRVLPLDVWHTASVGIDLWLSAIAHGASQVWVLMSDEEAPDYRAAVQAQMAVAEAILQGLGYVGEHFRVVDARGLNATSPDAAALRLLDAALRRPVAATVTQAASFSVQADKRATLDLAIDHLLAQAASAPEAIALPSPASPFGSLQVNTDRCTLCLSCVGACPEGALADNTERPQLRFIESKCVQCGLCATTCPEDAITLAPRLWLADHGKARRQTRVLHEAEPFQCVRCHKPFGTLRAIESMAAKLAGHAMFQGAAAERLKMCGDCRVIDIHTNANEVRITDL